MSSNYDLTPTEKGDLLLIGSLLAKVTKQMEARFFNVKEALKANPEMQAAAAPPILLSTLQRQEKEIDEYLNIPNIGEIEVPLFMKKALELLNLKL